MNSYRRSCLDIVERASSLIFLSLTLSSPVQGQNHPAHEGTILGGRTYHNAALGMTISLPGPGEIIGKASQLDPNASRNSSRLAGCEGPLCGPASIDVAIESRHLESRRYAILLAAYELPPEYQDSTKHVLKNFADVMIVRSSGKLWVPDSGLTPMRLGRRPAFRLLAHNRRNPSAKAFMYVSKSNGYVFMLVATAISASEQLRSAVENMQLGN